MKEFSTTKNEWVEPEAGPRDDYVIPQRVMISQKEPKNEHSEPKYPVNTSETKSDESHIAISFSIRLNIYPMTIAMGVIGCLYGVYRLIKNNDT